MNRPPLDQLSPTQRIIVSCAAEAPGRYTRSEMAKLLVGSQSTRAGGLTGQPGYGRLSGHGRKAITFEIDILLQQGYLAVNGRGRLEAGA